MKEKGYTPKAGTKVALAVTAMLDGPMTIPDLAQTMNCAPKDVNALLFVALKHRFMVRVKDETGLLHYALGGMPLDERFTAVDASDKAEEPVKKKPNRNQGAFPPNPFPVSESVATAAPPQIDREGRRTAKQAVRSASARTQVCRGPFLQWRTDDQRRRSSAHAVQRPHQSASQFS